MKTKTTTTYVCDHCAAESENEEALRKHEAECRAIADQAEKEKRREEQQAVEWAANFDPLVLLVKAGHLAVAKSVFKEYVTGSVYVRCSRPRELAEHVIKELLRLNK